MRTIKATFHTFIAAAFCSPAMAQAPRVSLHIEPQPVRLALKDLGEQTGLQIMFRAEDLAREEMTAPRISGELSPREALDRMLANTGLRYRFVNPNTVLVSAQAADGGKTTQVTEMNAVRVAQAGAAGNAGSQSSGQDAQDKQRAAGAEGARVEEIVVTAQKRAERLQDVPVPVTAISGRTLVDSNLLRLQDYYTRIPGLSLSPNVVQGQGAPILIIRGLATGVGTNPTVGVTVDDVPYGSSSARGLGFLVPDLDPSDLARIEVLRGPQGTLYGASSMGGLLKFVTVDPSTERFSGNVQAGMSNVHNGADLGYSVRGAVNVPLSDTWAVRVSGFDRQDPGYIDNPTLDREGVNKGEARGGYLSALWRPSPSFSLKLNALMQKLDVHGAPEVDVGLGDLQQNDWPGTGGYDKKFEVYSAIVTAKLGGVDLTSISGYNIDTVSNSSQDFTPAFGALTLANFGVRGTPLLNYDETRKFTQEIRLSAPIGTKLEWLAGAFYTREDTDPRVTDIFASDPSGAVVGQWLHNNAPFTYSEYAVFADLTVHVTGRFDVQVGGRESRNRQSYSSTLIGPYVPVFFPGNTSPRVEPQLKTRDSSFTYLVTPRFKLSSDLMVYARLASGYRPGGPNPNATALGVPTGYDPDTTRNYEIGAKGDIGNGMLSFDASVYYIDWRDIQVGVTAPCRCANYNANGSRAKSQGIELSLEARPWQGFAAAAWVAWNDAELTEPLPVGSLVRGLAGDRLPYSARWSGNLSLDQDFPLSNVLTGFVGASFSYVGDRLHSFVAAGQRLALPSYTQADARAGVRFDTWTATAFVTNIADQRGVLGIGQFNNPLYLTQPRTVGLSIAKSF